MFFAPTRQPVMHEPHSVQPVRAGPGAAEVRVVGTRSPGRPKYTPTGVGWYVSGHAHVLRRPSCITTSDGVCVGLVTTPSIRLAWS